MKRFVLRILQWKLTFLAKRVLHRYAPVIVGVAGSVGKTSSVQAIALGLGRDYRVGQTLRSYNQELGVPLSILRQETGYRSLWRWIAILFRGCWLAFGSKDATYPNLLVLELGADSPGDIDKLMTWVRPQVGVLTAATVEHVEFFGSIEAAMAEERKVIIKLSKTAVAVMNADDPNVMVAVGSCKARIVRYGLGEGADVTLTNAGILGADANTVQGVSAKVVVGGSSVPIVVRETLGRHSLYAVGAAFAVAHALGVKLTNASEQLRTYQAPAGRMRLIRGIKNTVIIDDTYNSSPAAANAALDTLHELSTPGRKYAVLGDMRELGPVSDEEHAKLGRYAVGKTDVLITVGESAKHIAHAAIAASMPEDRVMSFDKPDGVGNFLQDKMKPTDLILVKASQGTRCEKVVKEIMAEPARAGELLTRQYRPWI
ncbi:MAG: UDP-N-acetylmuramoyl-tripeptide--D-alanyl-D-alanine ligase [bacterium]|nr:UDP-N-acetylmuramoyl-tripeptide--D-alanyl-D-alanine ligase [bacterium]